jgi:hypothetical protein
MCIAPSDANLIENEVSVGSILVEHISSFAVIRKAFPHYGNYAVMTKAPVSG